METFNVNNFYVSQIANNLLLNEIYIGKIVINALKLLLIVINTI